jgi:hypothetical protein
MITRYNLDLTEGKEFQVKRGHWLPEKLKVDYFVFGKTMYCRHHGDRLPRHEFLHLAQFAKHGIPGVLVHYVYHGVKNLIMYRKLSTAFLQIPFEVEARAYASEAEGRTGA